MCEVRCLWGYREIAAATYIQLDDAWLPQNPLFASAGFCVMKFSEAIDKFKGWRLFKVKGNTVKGYDRELRMFCLFLRNPNIEDIRLQDVMEYLNGMKELGWDHNSFVGKCMAIRKFLEFFRLQGYRVLDENLVPVPHKEYNIPRVADEASYYQLLNAIPKHSHDPRHIRNKAIIKMLWDTGARNGEILQLDVGDVDLQNCRAVIRTEKNKGRRPIREIYWTEETSEAIADWLAKRRHLQTVFHFKDPDALFLSVTGTKEGQRLSVKGVGEMLRHYSNTAKIPYMNAHSFRHHMGHDIIKKGGSAADVMNILGHSSLASSTIYTMMTNKELEDRYRYFKGINEREADEIRKQLQQRRQGRQHETVPVRIGAKPRPKGRPEVWDLTKAATQVLLDQQQEAKRRQPPAAKKRLHPGPGIAGW